MKSGSQDILREARTCIRRVVDEVRSDRVVKTIFVWRLKPVDGDGLFYVSKSHIQIAYSNQNKLLTQHLIPQSTQK